MESICVHDEIAHIRQFRLKMPDVAIEIYYFDAAVPDQKSCYCRGCDLMV
jgi:hypothetical protein